MSRPDIAFTLSLPTSVNRTHVQRPDGQVYRSGAYNAWRKTAGNEFLRVKSKLPCKELPHGWYRLRLRWPVEDAADVTNRTKALVDWLVWMKITPDDRWLWAISEGRSRHVGRGLCSVRVWSVTP